MRAPTVAPFNHSLSPLLVMLALVAGCEGVITGKEVVTVALQPTGDGGYGPVKFALGPDMNPVAINLHANYSQDRQESGKWNTYRATLKVGAKQIATRDFNVNYPAAAGSDASSPPPTSLVHTLWIVDLKDRDDYEVTIAPLKPVEVTLVSPRIEVRRNVQRPPA